MEERATNLDRPNGIYVIHKKYARGFDMKLLKDAFVMILSIKINLPWSVVNQMVGRGCRSFGVADGCYYTTQLTQSCNLKDTLSNFEPNLKEGAKIVDALYKKGEVLNPNELKSMRTVFESEDNWMRRLADFRHAHPAQYNLLFPKGHLNEADAEVENIFSSQ
mgnify:CR=1 FL=1